MGGLSQLIHGMIGTVLLAIFVPTVIVIIGALLMIVIAAGTIIIAPVLTMFAIFSFLAAISKT